MTKEITKPALLGMLVSIEPSKLVPDVEVKKGEETKTKTAPNRSDAIMLLQSLIILGTLENNKVTYLASNDKLRDVAHNVDNMVFSRIFNYLKAMPFFEVKETSVDAAVLDATGKATDDLVTVKVHSIEIDAKALISL